ncbi:MAG: DUF2244 domain-containing protein [Hyphomicrobiales bacterium]
MSVTITDAASSRPIRFRMALTPRRSLGSQGFFVVMGILGGASLVAGLAFVLMGAWPVCGYFGLDVALVYWALNRNFADAMIRETIILRGNELVVRRARKADEPRQWRFAPPHWVRVEIEENDRLKICESLCLVSHGRKLTIGSFLSPGERRKAGLVLRRALASPYTRR